MKSSVYLSQTDHYHLSLNLELLRGCQFSCKGCHVQKYAAKPLQDAWVERLNHWMRSAIAEGLHRPSMVFISPTDILASDNTFEVLEDPRVIAIVQQFRRLSIQTTCLDVRHAERLGGVLRKHFAHMELEVNILLEPEHVETQKYLDRVLANQQYLWDMIDWPTRIHSFCILNVFEYSRAKKESTAALLGDYEAMHRRITTLFGTTLDFNFSMSRKAQPAPKEIEIAIHRVRDLFDDGVKLENNRTIRFSFGKLTDSLIEKHYNFLNGELYVSPMLYDRYAGFTEALRIPFTDHTVHESEAFEAQLELAQYASAPSKTSCGNCSYLGMCVSRNLLAVMDEHQIVDCIVARDALNVINQSSA